jgi:muramoyltetrapeptide carboxypeptidase
MTSMKTPLYLKQGDSIGIVATARKISREELEPSIKKFTDWGLKVILGKNIYENCNQYAGTDDQRAFDLQQMLDDESIKAIVIARGGYGTLRIIDKIDFTSFIRSPKWIVGYSDVTVLHSHIHHHYGIETMHATMPLNFPPDGKDNNALSTLKKALFGEKISYEIDLSFLNKVGKAEGILIGGNLSLLYALAGTPSDINTSGKILFIEDLDEYLYHIDRMMMQLKRSGKLKYLAGLVVGGMTEMKDNTVPFGKTAYEIIAEAVAEYNYPVCYSFPAGHIIDNRALIMGRKVLLEVSMDKASLSFMKN